MRWLADLDVFCGRTTPQLAQVFFRLRQWEALRDCTLSGRLRGPECAYSQTLASTSVIRDLGPGATRLAQAAVVDPCYWSAQLPMLYHVTAELHRGEELVERAELTIGLRRLAVERGHFLWHGKRWVLRGVQPLDIDAATVPAWRDSHTVLVIVNPEPDVCAAASRDGVPILAVVEKEPADREAYLHRLARFPSVLAAVLEDHADFEALGALTPDFLYGAHLSSAGSAGTGSAFQFLPWEYAQERLADPRRRHSPLVVYRSLTAAKGTAARAACDELQRDLAPWGEAAGYVVRRTR